MRKETNCTRCIAAVLVLTLEPREGESIDRCAARMTRAAGWSFVDGAAVCPDCTAKPAAPAAAEPPARGKKQR